MLPIRDSIPSRQVAWVSRGLIAANILAFALELHQGSGLEAFIYRFSVIPSQWALASPADLLEWPRLALTLLTSQFLHAGYLHLGANMLFLWIFGDNVEDRLGHARFLRFYLVCGAAAAAAQILMSPGSTIPMVGASGAIAGVLGAYFLLFPTARIVTLVPMGFFWQTVELPAYLYLGVWFLLQWAQGLLGIGMLADVGGVAFWAHAGGFVAGMLGVVFLRSRRRW
jgi:membrane associated rhomboid family serine protease